VNNPSKRYGFIRKLITKPARAVLLGYASYVLITWILLSIPISWQSEAISPLDNLFIATSAISTTGLITVNTPDAYSFIGELIIACAFQIGGLGYMTLGSFVILAHDERLPSAREQIGQTVFSLPERFNFKLFIQHTIIFTALIELAGFICLYIAFSIDQVPDALWAAIFHSISAFCTAGFSIFPNSLVDFSDNLFVNFVVSLLSLFGAIGFIVISDAWLTLRHRRSRVTLTTKIILTATFGFILAGWLFLFFCDQAIATLPLGERFLVSGFQSMTAMTTVGFNSYPIEDLFPAPVLVMIILMVIGASPSGTGGGLKTTSISAGFGAVWATLRGSRDVSFWGRRIPLNRLLGAFAAVMFYLSMFLVGAVLLLLAQEQAFADVIFEVASALGTVGLSRGLTGDLLPLGKLIIIALMFVGRVGPITFGLAFFNPSRRKVRLAAEDIAL
jgi:trk system potassium uptake protein TrkH